MFLFLTLCQKRLSKVLNNGFTIHFRVAKILVKEPLKQFLRLLGKNGYLDKQQKRIYNKKNLETGAFQPGRASGARHTIGKSRGRRATIKRN